MSDNRNAEQAADILVHYFRMIAEAAGVPWDGENAAELRDAVDRLMDAVEDEVRTEVNIHAESAPHIYADGSTS